MVALPAREGYRLWAPHYAAETAISFLEDRLVARLRLPVAGRSLLDVGCGSARRLAAARVAGAAPAVGVDLTPEMLARALEPQLLAAADVRALPFAAATFDVVWCRLVIGHLAEPTLAYAELGRVCRPGGTVVVTDFHPDAAAAGHRRTFRDATGVVREVEHHVHAPTRHAAAARAAGLAPVARRDGAVGPAVRAFYEAAERLDAYEAQRGLRVVLALAYRRTA
ncbi:MAG TPA: class I SAM-dependent methyltransferase [Gemmatimonadaceae bacterium]|nr:class I SAM-dependent methyltransferase [Gemmatimonadaceae bacterium]